MINPPGRWSLYVVAISVFGVPAANGQLDRVSLRDEQTGEVSQFNADVVDWDARRLVILVNGRNREIPGRRVVDVVFPRDESHIEADALFAAGKLPLALEAYNRAITPQQRSWITRVIRARRMQCAIGLGQWETAIDEFLRITEANPETRFFHLIPLAWEGRTPPPPNIHNWLKGSGEIRALIAASWLLMRQPDDAVAALNALRQSDDSRVAHLATAQRWRTNILTATEDELQRWQTAVQRMPHALQAGPRYVVADARQRLALRGSPSEAAVNRVLTSLLEIPILFPEHYQLAAAGLLEARNVLRQAGRLREANILDQELQRDYGYSHAAAMARQHISEFQNENASPDNR